MNVILNYMIKPPYIIIVSSVINYMFFASNLCNKNLSNIKTFLNSIILELFFKRAVYFSSVVNDTKNPWHRYSDEDIVKMSQNGDMDAFSILVKRYERLTFSICLRYLRNKETAEEVSQDIFLTLYKKIYQFQGQSSFKSWYYQILVNHCKNQNAWSSRRKANMHDSINNKDENSKSYFEIPDSKPNAESLLAESEKRLVIEDALGKISEESRMLLILRESNNLSYEEVSSSLGISLGTVKSKLHRARAEFKNIVENLWSKAVESI